MGDFDPPDWAQLWDPAGSVHLNVQGEPDCRRPRGRSSRASRRRCSTSRSRSTTSLPRVAFALAAGGREAPWQPPDRDPERIRIVLDPAGHPLCLFLHGE